MFDAAAPGGSYTLNLSEPYGQMVAEECIYLLNFRVGCELKRIEYTPKMSMPFKTVHLEREKVMHKTELAPANMQKFCQGFMNEEHDKETFLSLIHI